MSSRRGRDQPARAGNDAVEWGAPAARLPSSPARRGLRSTSSSRTGWWRERPEPQVRALGPVTDGRAGLLPPGLPTGRAFGRQVSRPSGYWVGMEQRVVWAGRPIQQASGLRSPPKFIVPAQRRGPSDGVTPWRLSRTAVAKARGVDDARPNAARPQAGDHNRSFKCPDSGPEPHQSAKPHAKPNISTAVAPSCSTQREAVTSRRLKFGQV